MSRFLVELWSGATWSNSRSDRNSFCQPSNWQVTLDTEHVTVLGERGGIMQSEVTVTMSHFVITMSRTIHMWSNTSSFITISVSSLQSLWTSWGKMGKWVSIFWSQHTDSSSPLTCGPGAGQMMFYRHSAPDTHSHCILWSWPPHPIPAIIYLTLDIAHWDKVTHQADTTTHCT